MMKIILFFFLICIVVQPFAGYCQERFPNDQEDFYQKAMAQINPKHVRYIKSTAIDVNKKKLEEPAVIGLVKSYAVVGSMGNADIEALVFLVMMQAAKDAREDLKGIMAQVKSLNEQKKALREANDRLNRNANMVTRMQLDSFKLLLVQQPYKNTRVRINKNAVTVTEINETKEQFKNKLDSMSEMGEKESLKLQMAIDRLSKMIETLSNIMKNIRETQQQVIKNLL